jgi:hypothetical protein
MAGIVREIDVVDRRVGRRQLAPRLAVAHVVDRDHVDRGDEPPLAVAAEEGSRRQRLRIDHEVEIAHADADGVRHRHEVGGAGLGARRRREEGEDSQDDQGRSHARALPASPRRKLTHPR